MFPIRDDNPQINKPYATYAIIALNALAWVLMQGMGSDEQLAKSVCEFGLIPADLFAHDFFSNEGFSHESVSRCPDGAGWGGVFSSMFMHGGWMHLIGNMWFLWIFGNNIEDRLGHLIFPLFYFAGGIGAAAVHWAIDPVSNVPVIGASGAVAAVLGAYALTYPTAKVRTLIFLGVFIRIIDIPAMVVLGLWFLLQMVQGLIQLGPAAGGGVAWWAHVGGFGVGMVLMPLLTIGAPPPGKDWREESKRMFDLPGI
jgi:membrane associated rhomboid family serine protease